MMRARGSLGVAGELPGGGVRCTGDVDTEEYHAPALASVSVSPCLSTSLLGES